jgi:protein-S-isoprenylcysteine O-methyltransferase Ste14
MPIDLSRLAIWLVHITAALYWDGVTAISSNAFQIARDMWVVFGVYWMISAFRHRAVKKAERLPEQLLHVLPMAVAFALIFQVNMSFGLLGARFAPASAVKDVTGLWLTAVGVAFAIWARRHLGTNWSASITIRSEHELVGTGPYRYVRHPIYTGMIVGLTGTALVVGEVRAVVGVAIAIVSFYLKAHKEEMWLTREFGPQFNAQAKDKGMFLPKIAAL